MQERGTLYTSSFQAQIANLVQLFHQLGILDDFLDKVFMGRTRIKQKMESTAENDLALQTYF